MKEKSILATSSTALDLNDRDKKSVQYEVVSAFLTRTLIYVDFWVLERYKSESKKLITRYLLDLKFCCQILLRCPRYERIQDFKKLGFSERDLGFEQF